MEQGDDGVLELSALVGVDDRPADVGGDVEGDAGALLEQLVQQWDDEAGQRPPMGYARPPPASFQTPSRLTMNLLANLTLSICEIM